MESGSDLGVAALAVLVFAVLLSAVAVVVRLARRTSVPPVDVRPRPDPHEDVPPTRTRRWRPATSER